MKPTIKEVQIIKTKSYKGQVYNLGLYLGRRQIVAYKIEETTLVKRESSVFGNTLLEPETVVYEGIAGEEDYVKFFSSSSSDLLDPYRTVRSNIQYRVLTKGDLHHLKTTGKIPHDAEKHRILSCTPYTAIETLSYGTTAFVNISGPINYRYLNGEYINTTIRFDYGCNITDLDIKVRKAHKILAKRKDVSNLTIKPISYRPGASYLKFDYTCTSAEFAKTLKLVNKGSVCIQCNQQSAAIYLGFLGLDKALKKSFKRALYDIYGKVDLEKL